MFTAAKIKATHGKGADFYRQHLANNDYYSEHDRVEGHWRGRLTSVFGLENESVAQDVFSLFQQNLNPSTKQKLTPRNHPNSVRFYDFQCSAQKSVSVMSLFDSRLVEAHRKAVEVGMRELERFAAVRIRKGESYATKNFEFTGKFIYAQYHHDNSRMLDPQLHTHNVIVNVTQEGNGSFKALDPSQMFKAIRYAGKSYQNELACECRRLGYALEMKRNGKGEITGFEIAGVPEEVLIRCSQRRQQIEKGIAEFYEKNQRYPTAKEIKAITLKTRSRKMLERTEQQVREHKLSLMTDEERSRFTDMAYEAEQMSFLLPSRPVQETPEQQIQKVAEQLFERSAVLSEDALLAEVQNQNLGNCNLDELRKTLDCVPGLVNLSRPSGNPYFTTETNLKQENYVIETVNAFRDLLPEIRSERKPFSKPPFLSGDHTVQREAIETILGSKSPFVLFRGVAGAGKTSTLKELCECLKSGGVENIQLIAPTNSAVDVLKKERFTNAQTVVSFLQNPQALPPKGSYLIIDESGLNSLSQGTGIIKLALQNDYRVLFVGDARQHNSVESGDFFRLLEEHTQIPKATLTQIHRQQTAEYRKGIELASTGLALEGFETLDHGGFVREGKGRYLEDAAESFMELTDQGKNPLSCIAVSPTHRECDALTAILREKLKAAGRLKAKTERNIVTFQSFGWTKAQLGNIANYQPGMKLFFTNRLKGIGKPGEMVGIEQVKSSGELVLSNGLTVNPRTIRSAVDVGESTELPVAEGDLVRFTVNLKTPEFKISNGSLAIATATPNEYSLLDAERRITGTVCLPESFHGIRHGWVMTSHASQGMTADHVVVAAEKMSKQAFYVGCSRGRFKLALHLPDRERFKEGLLRIPTERLSVADLVKSGEIEKPNLEHLRRIREQYDPDPYRLMRSCHLKRVVAKLRRAGRQATAAVMSVIRFKLSSKCRRNYVASRMEEYQRQLRKINVQAQERKMEETQATSQVHRIVEQESPATANEMKRNRPRPVRKGPER
mgnify:FL=1